MNIGTNTGANMSINPNWHDRKEAEGEEYSCLANIFIGTDTLCFSTGYDPETKEEDHAPLLSAFFMAEWMAWNWWRLRWEGVKNDQNSDWGFAHRMASIGHGYIWPNITIASDLHRIIIKADPNPDKIEFHYIADEIMIMPVATFETMATDFITKTIKRLDESGCADTNLHMIWHELKEEKQDPEMRQIRKIEAILGYEPDEMPPIIAKQYLKDQAILGEAAIDEMLAAHAAGTARLYYNEIKILADTNGRNITNAIKPINALPINPAQNNPKDIGNQLACDLRGQIDNEAQPLDNKILADMLGTKSDIIDTHESNHTPISFCLNDHAKHTKLVFKSTRYITGRRFELARLLGAKIIQEKINAQNEIDFSPVTKTYTWTQKAQRAFAAELLCPHNALLEFFESNLSDYHHDYQQKKAAKYFGVSPLTIRTILVNHGYLDQSILNMQSSVLAEFKAYA